jgi:hypothetical protein
MSAPFTADMESLARALSEGDHGEVEFCAYRIHLAAKALGRTDVASAAASVVAAYRIPGAEASRPCALEALAQLSAVAARR